MTQKALDADFIVIGSGPAGVSVSYPLIEVGAKVLMIDGCGPRPGVYEPVSVPLHKMLGEKLEALVPDDGLSPKLRTPTARRFVREFHGAISFRAQTFNAIGAIARGGLSQVWGGFVSEFNDADTKGWPFSIDDLKLSYKIITERIGISGIATDQMAEFYGNSGALEPPLPIGSSASRLLQSYLREPYPEDFVLGPARNAILTVERAYGRKACDLRKGCLWGCPRGAIYDALFDLSELKRRHGFHLVDDALAIRLAPLNGAWEVTIRDGRKLYAARVILAAGTLGTLALAAPLLPSTAELRLLSSPVFAMPLLILSRLLNSPSSSGHSLAQLGYTLRFGRFDDEYITGAVYEVDSLPISSFTARMPLSRPAANQLFVRIAPAVIIANSYFSGRYSDNRIQLERRGSEFKISLKGGFDPALSGLFDIVTRRLRKIWRRLGAWTLPGTTLASPGTDVHYAGPFGMGYDTEYGTSALGEMHAARGVYIVDGAALPTLPSKPLTLTVMANADRIGRRLAERYRRQ
jgi:choline dehydrogenase-like flavoprotein